MCEVRKQGGDSSLLPLADLGLKKWEGSHSPPPPPALNNFCPAWTQDPCQGKQAWPGPRPSSEIRVSTVSLPEHERGLWALGPLPQVLCSVVPGHSQLCSSCFATWGWHLSRSFMPQTLSHYLPRHRSFLPCCCCQEFHFSFPFSQHEPLLCHRSPNELSGRKGMGQPLFVLGL